MKFTIEYHTRWGENLVLRSAGKSWPMSYVPDGKWSVELPAEAFFDGEAEREYFYEVVCDGLSTRHEWRLHSLKAAEKREEILDSWSDSPGWKGAGTAIPVFALRSEDDFGVGEFLDLKKMVDWAVLTGQTFLQLLPVNDTTMFGTLDDSYPYNANSTFALHPQFINLLAAGVPVDKEYLKLQKQLNSFVKDGRPETDYVSVNREKRRLLRKAFDANWKSLSRTKAYRNFLAANREWLIPYSRFCALRDEFGTPDFSQWGEFAVYDEARLERWNKNHRSETDLNCFLQFHLDAQFRQVRDYAHSKGVVLKGDLPIGISRTSADAWQFPKLFNMDSQAGAPPDAFSADGQNWGFPTYNWEEMAKDGYAWWKARLRKMSEYFDAFRIDHILGFFRIWQIPVPEKSGLAGYFSPAIPYSADELRSWGYGNRMDRFIEDPHRPGWYHPRIDAKDLGDLYIDFFYRRHNEFWKHNAMGKLSALLGSTNMLACGEDLGMIPACVPEVMQRLNILSLEIQRMPKDPAQTFADPARYPYGCVCTTSTHDMSPIRAWWEEDRALSQRFYNEALGCGGAAPYFCEPWVCRRIVEQHLWSPAMLVILPLQDWLSISPELRYKGNPADERINVPAIPRYHWDYRMHLSLEELLAAKDFNTDVATLVKSSGRN